MAAETDTETKKTVLVVDDDEDIAYLLGVALTDAGYGVHTVTSSAAVIPAAVQHVPNLVLLDVLLDEGQDGMELARALRANRLTSSIPVVLISARVDMTAALQQAERVNGITKPFRIAELLSVVERMIGPAGAGADAGSGAGT